MSDFNLRALIRDVCDTSTIADPQILAKEVNRKIKKTDRDAALEQALPVLVQNVISLGRSQASPGQGGHDAHSVIAGGFNPSRKVAGIREAWKQQRLRERLAVGPEPGNRRFLADCTAANCIYAAEVREDHARRNAASARFYRKLAELVTQYEVRTVGELPDDVLGPALSDAA